MWRSEPAKGLRGEEVFLFVVTRLHFFDESIGKLIVIELEGIDAGGLQVEAELIEDFVRKLRDIPLIRMLVARAINIHQLARNHLRLVDDKFLLIAAFKEGAAKGIDGSSRCPFITSSYSRRCFAGFGSSGPRRPAGRARCAC